ncbi:hypothetical protein F4821DRAFT_252907 [Hypoxylon rubiginosum]|uniref:Uncharacterized protein n=1 Tax=Hypoxylon rubiginosum TaxID=110542 RepID=A0ACC0DPE0_9PEZI|nr:hypothetical protein F4821DRAFT_252907 [Hypoxylon rubiginosum]
MADSLQLRRNPVKEPMSIYLRDLPYDYLPMFTRIQSTLNEVTTYRWWPPVILNRPQGAVLNLFLNRLDKLLYECEVSRQRKITWLAFKADRMREEFASQEDEEILLTLAQLAQDRAHMINYVLAHRVAPALHQEYIDTNCIRTVTDEDVREWERDFIRMFWGDELNPNPLPHPRLEVGKSSEQTSIIYGWADRIYYKLAAMQCVRGSEERIEWVQELFWWDGEPQVPRHPKPYEPSSAGSDSDESPKFTDVALTYNPGMTEIEDWLQGLSLSDSNMSRYSISPKE